MKVLVINGPNLNFIGIREKGIYGNNSYSDLVEYLVNLGKENNIEVEVYQSNHEGAIIDKLQSAYFEKVDGIIINAGAFTHYSYAIRDAIASTSIRTIEVHLSDITKREDFRKISVIKEVCDKTFFGKHFLSYKEALEYLLNNR